MTAQLSRSNGNRWERSNNGFIVTEETNFTNPIGNDIKLNNYYTNQKKNFITINPMSNNPMSNKPMSKQPTVQSVPNNKTKYVTQTYYSKPHTFISNSDDIYPVLTSNIEKFTNRINFGNVKNKNILYLKFKNLIKNPNITIDEIVKFYISLRNKYNDPQHIRKVDNILINMILILFYEEKNYINTILSNDVVKNVLKFYMDNIKALFPSFIKKLGLNTEPKRSYYNYFFKSKIPNQRRQIM